MQLLHVAASFGATENDLKQIYIQFIRSILEGSCQVWSGSLTAKNMSDLERIQKSAVKIICPRYTNYNQCLKHLKMVNLKSRYKTLTLNFARKAKSHDKLKHMFPTNDKIHNMKTQKTEVYKKTHANTQRFMKSPILYMQSLLNEYTIS